MRAESAQPRADVYEGCVRTFNPVCTECGCVGCCESQRGHNTQHALGAGHPVIKSLHAGPRALRCYECGRYVVEG
ncbi:MAG: UBP-type zinc finger domain-containing protein [Candidatus Limnocylindria bacterium]